MLLELMQEYESSGSVVICDSPPSHNSSSQQASPQEPLQRLRSGGDRVISLSDLFSQFASSYDTCLSKATLVNLLVKMCSGGVSVQWIQNIAVRIMHDKAPTGRLSFE